MFQLVECPTTGSQAAAVGKPKACDNTNTGSVGIQRGYAPTLLSIYLLMLPNGFSREPFPVFDAALAFGS